MPHCFPSSSNLRAIPFLFCKNMQIKSVWHISFSFYAWNVINNTSHIFLSMETRNFLPIQGKNIKEESISYFFLRFLKKKKSDRNLDRCRSSFSSITGLGRRDPSIHTFFKSNFPRVVNNRFLLGRKTVLHFFPHRTDEQKMAHSTLIIWGRGKIIPEGPGRVVVAVGSWFRATHRHAQQFAPQNEQDRKQRSSRRAGNCHVALHNRGTVK